MEMLKLRAWIVKDGIDKRKYNKTSRTSNVFVETEASSCYLKVVTRPAREETMCEHSPVRTLVGFLYRQHMNASYSFFLTCNYRICGKCSVVTQMQPPSQRQFIGLQSLYQGNTGKSILIHRWYINVALFKLHQKTWPHICHPWVRSFSKCQAGPGGTSWSESRESLEVDSQCLLRFFTL